MKDVRTPQLAHSKLIQRAQFSALWSPPYPLTNLASPRAVLAFLSPYRIALTKVGISSPLAFITSTPAPPHNKERNLKCAVDSVQVYYESELAPTKSTG